VAKRDVSQSADSTIGYRKANPLSNADVADDDGEISAVPMNRTLPGKAVAKPLKFTLILLLLFAFGVSPLHAAQAPSASTGKMLIAADIHFNPMFDPSLVAQLDAAEAAQWENILNGSKMRAFSQYGQDTNWWLLQSALDQMLKTLPHPALVMIAGDTLSHQFPQTYQSITHDGDREHYRKFVLKTMKFLALQLRKRYPDTKILITPGNNDEDCGNYSIEAGGRFLHDTAEQVRDLAQGDDQMRGAWEDLGSFDVAHPTIPGLRIISLNTILFSEKYHAAKFSDGCATVASNGPDEAFNWLESRLSRAKAAHEKVWIMFHIPPGIDSYASIQKYQAVLKNAPEQASNRQQCLSGVVPLWVPARTAQFESLLKKYHGTVLAGFSGHIHVDDFRVIEPSGSDATFVLITPAISPVYNQNPSFRTVTFAKDGLLLDSSVYYLTNLIYASSATPGEWEQEYQFSKEWKLPRIDAAGLSSLYNKIQSDEGVRGEWLKLYNVSSSAAYVVPGSVPGLYCAAEQLDPESYARCYCPTQPGDHAGNNNR
jgi:sphingomyelin phosphodiesterase acid-like 3